MYFIKMMTGEKFAVTDEEFKQLVNASGEVLIKSCMAKINLKMVSAMYPQALSEQVEDRRQMQTGRLHDGTRVRRHFGEWVDADSQVPDDNGKYMPVRLDPNYYPEVAKDCVASETEFEKLQALPPAERLKIMLGGREAKQLQGSEGLQKISFNN